MPVELFLALRFMRDSRAQTVLIIAGVGVGVAVIVFLTALISGLQRDLIAKTLGTQPHVVIEPAEEQPRPLLARSEPDLIVTSRIDKAAQRIRSIDGWQKLIAQVRATPAVVASSPMVAGPGFALRGMATQPVQIMGVEAESFQAIVDLRARLVLGRMALTGRDIIIGVALAGELGVGIGDDLRVQSPDGAGELFTVRGIFDVGNKAANASWVVMSLQSAQALLNLVGGVSRIDVTITEIFAAEDMAQLLAERTGLRVESWMQRNAELLRGLRAQSSSSTMIQVFVIVAVAIGIASVLVVSVVQRSREIGILRAIGVSRQRILRVFLLQGAMVGLVGSGIGSALGAALAALFRSVAKADSGAPLFPIVVEPGLVATAALIAVATGLAAAAYPARRAAQLEPATAIRNE